MSDNDCLVVDAIALSRLRALDPHIPFISPNINIPQTSKEKIKTHESIKNAFKIGFEKIKNRQIEEMVWFYFELYIKKELGQLNGFTEIPETLLQLEVNHEILNTLNLERILSILPVSPERCNKHVNFRAKYLTRLPAAVFFDSRCGDFWRHIEVLDVSENYLIALPESMIEACVALKTLNWEGNEITVLPEAMTDLKDVKVFNKLDTVPTVLLDLCEDDLLESPPDDALDLSASDTPSPAPLLYNSLGRKLEDYPTATEDNMLIKKFLKMQV